MKHIHFIILLAVLFAITAKAQTETPVSVPQEDLNGGSPVPSLTAEPVGDLRSSIDPLPNDSLHLPRLNWRGQMPFSISPFWGWMTGLGYWTLHDGLNMSLSASVFGSWGGGSYLGTGFSQDISAMYAMPLTNKLSLAIGGYFSNVNFAHDNFRYGGLSGVLSYRFNDHWEAHLYGQKSLVETTPTNPSSLIMHPYYGMGNIGDRIGAGVIYHVNPTFSFEVNVEYMEQPLYYVPVYRPNRDALTPSNHGAPPPPR